MCIICVELLKQNITYVEAEKASDEMVRLQNRENFTHYFRLNQALEKGDLEKLGQILKEGQDTENNSRTSTSW